MKLPRFLWTTAQRGAAALHQDGAAETRRFVVSRQTPGGGFHGPGDPNADLYYGLFGAVCLAALSGIRHGLKLRAYLARSADGARDLPHAAAYAALRRLALMRRPRIDLADFTTADGGFTHLPGRDDDGTAYGAYLALILCQTAGLKFPRQAVAKSLAKLATPDGGVANRPSSPVGAATATAAAIMVGVFAEVDVAIDARRNYLLHLAAPAGGFPAHDEAPLCDLLSTASALSALAATGGVPEYLRTSQARFVENCWTENGGFREHPQFGNPDVEYTFYALLALGSLDAAVFQNSPN